ncbi:MAG: hypothetical protein MZW92_65475 [Comamonadaceae bacterium]|nr:hypothetical protein [Comamonadaceae bacterium]
MIEVALARFEQDRALRRELADANRKLSERKVVEPCQGAADESPRPDRGRGLPRPAQSWRWSAARPSATSRAMSIAMRAAAALLAEMRRSDQARKRPDPTSTAERQIRRARSDPQDFSPKRCSVC